MNEAHVKIFIDRAFELEAFEANLTLTDSIVPGAYCLDW
jgi:hypothetical protein